MGVGKSGYKRTGREMPPRRAASPAAESPGKCSLLNHPTGLVGCLRVMLYIAGCKVNAVNDQHDFWGDH